MTSIHLNNFYSIRKNRINISNEIEMFEIELGCRLPSDYKLFLISWYDAKLNNSNFSFFRKNDESSLDFSIIYEFFNIENIKNSIETILSIEDAILSSDDDYNFRIYNDSLLPIARVMNPLHGIICIGIKGSYYGRIFFQDVRLDITDTHSTILPIANSFTQLILFPEDRTFINELDLYEDWRLHLLVKRENMLLGWYIQKIEEKLLYKIPKGYGMILRKHTGELCYGKEQYYERYPISALIKGKSINIAKFYAIEDYLSNTDTMLHTSINLFRAKDMMPIAICTDGEVICLGFGLENSNIVSLWAADYNEKLEEWFTFMGFIDEVAE